jgi:hypothetical protein
MIVIVTVYTFTRMKFNETSALNSATQSGLEGSGTQPTIQIKLNEQENQILSDVSRVSSLSQQEGEITHLCRYPYQYSV